MQDRWHVMTLGNEPAWGRARELFEREYSADIIYPRFVAFLEGIARGRKPTP